MLARLQQALVLACLIAAALAATWAWQRGWPGWAVALLAAGLALPHGPVLALEFTLLWRYGRDGSAPAPSAGQLLRAWAHEVLHGLQVFAWRQPFFEHAVADVPAPPRAAARPGQPAPPGPVGVLLVHGFVCNRALWAPWLRRWAAEGVPCRALSLAPVFGPIESHGATVQAAIDALRAETGRDPLVVAHSMGGLVTRAWLDAWHTAHPGRPAPVAGVITIGTPHHGTWLARLAFSPNGRQMRMGNPWLQALAAREAARSATPYAGFTCFYSHCDNIVFPAGQATLAGADNRHLPATAHVQLAFHPEVWAAVQARRQALARA